MEGSTIHKSILPHKPFEGIPLEVMSVRDLRTGMLLDSLGHSAVELLEGFHGKEVDTE